MSEPRVVPVFIPSLISILVRAERDKGRPLLEDEVLSIRDQSICVMMPEDRIPAFEQERGYSDLDPEFAWEQWQQARVELMKD